MTLSLYLDTACERSGAASASERVNAALQSTMRHDTGTSSPLWPLNAETKWVPANSLPKWEGTAGGRDTDRDRDRQAERSPPSSPVHSPLAPLRLPRPASVHAVRAHAAGSPNESQSGARSSSALPHGGSVALLLPPCLTLRWSRRSFRRPHSPAAAVRHHPPVCRQTAMECLRLC